MSRAVYKYKMPVSDDVSLLMPKGAKILALQWQGNVPCIWALVDPDAPAVMRMFRYIGTGHFQDNEFDALEFVGTIQLAGHGLVFHLFAQPEAA